MTDDTAPPLPAAGGSYRLDGTTLKRVTAPTKPVRSRAKDARFVGTATPSSTEAPAAAAAAPTTT